jgi:photosystem II stability/assembly factor-like uncharacterized protein
LNSVFFLDSSHGWAVGSTGTLLYFNGVGWVPVAAGVSSNLNSVAQVNPQEAWAVGDSGTILHWNGISWYQTAPSPSISGNPNLNSIFISSNGFGLIVGAPQAAGSQGTILQVSTLNPIPEVTTPQLVLAAVFGASLIVIQIRHRRLG